MPKRTHSPIAELGVNAVEEIVLGKLGWIWREQYRADFGIDGQIETVSADGRPTGRLIAVQIKSGHSYFKGNDRTIPLYVDDAHVQYWDQHALPVIVVIHNPNDKRTLWQWASLKSARRTSSGWCIDIPQENLFSDSKAALVGEVWRDDSLGLRRRFALDRELMKECEGRDVYVTIDKWVNKTLSFREIRIWFDRTDKKEPDYEIPIMATWHYEVAELMHHFLPWLDYEYLDEPEDLSGEIEGHAFEATLSEVAKAFLVLEAFFDNPPGPKNTEPSADPDVESDYDSDIFE